MMRTKLVTSDLRNVAVGATVFTGKLRHGTSFVCVNVSVPFSLLNLKIFSN